MDETGLEIGAATSETPDVAEVPTTFDQMAGAWTRNRHRIPLEYLEPYLDRYVAWNPQVTRIIAAAERVEELVAAIEAGGYDVALCPTEFVG